MKIAKKFIRAKLVASLYPEDFQGAAPDGVDIICLSSDEEEEMCDLNMTSVLDLQLSSEDEEIDDEITMISRCNYHRPS